MRIIVAVGLLLLHLEGWAQVSELNKGNGLLFSVGLGVQLPGGDMADRFGINMNTGAGLDFITQKSNIIVGLNAYYLFGTNVKEDVISALRTPEGQIIGNDKSYADIQLRERGFYIGGLVGKLFTLSQKNPRSGLRVTLGAGLLQHKIRIQDDPFRAVPQLYGDYKKGYDRLSNGLSFHQFIGYQILSTDKHTNFYIGLELTQGFTQNRRDFNFDNRTQDDTQRIDLLLGIKAAWILPFYIGKAASEIYY
ncbi:MAG: hypothetical protein SFU99_06120 [Saprospiraceae bacterium]|nr:hypothetical protein [Saprospiraceae bacterium]